MLFILFLTFKYLFEPFYAPFLKITKNGGDVTMEKATKILCVISAVIGALFIAMFFEESRTFIVNGVKSSLLNPIYGIGVAINNWLSLYPGLWILGGGLLGGLVLAVLINSVALSKIRKTPKPVGPLQGGPDVVPGSVVSHEPLATEIPQVEKELEAAT